MSAAETTATAADDIAERVRRIVVEHLGVDRENVTDNARFVDDLGADSLDTLELIMAFEGEFEVAMPADADETILTVGAAIAWLRNERAARAAAVGKAA